MAACSVAASSRTIPKCCCKLHRFQRDSPRSNSADVHMKRPKTRFAVRAANPRDSKSDSGGPSMVDAEMIVLRKRIHELRMQEMKYTAPQNWMEWEKRWYSTYASDICASLVRLQSILLNTRPGIAMGLLVLISFSVPVSVLLVFMEVSVHLNSVSKNINMFP